MSYLKRGVAGEPVRILQEKLGVTADGNFGPGTEAALKGYQAEHGLAADGIAGPDTFAAIGLHELILLGVGAKGDTVKKLQTALGIGADGKFGPGTAKSVKDFQASKGLPADGIAGPATLAALNIFSELTADKVAASVIPADQIPAAPDVPAADEALAGIVSQLNEPSAADASGSKSIWATVKGWIS
jgi:peptidoglycan hydrolase-like protein with peptidoglycan-binding domain